MELARLFSAADVHTERSIRFAFWNNEETDYGGSRAYIAQRRALQGREDPRGSGRYPEPKWLGLIQHDMMLFDHGMPRADGTVRPEQRPEADVNIEFQSDSAFARQSQELAWMFQAANELYATDYPAPSAITWPAPTRRCSWTSCRRSAFARTNAACRSARAGIRTGTRPTDVFATFSDNDFRLGLNAAQTTLGAIGRLAGATLLKRALSRAFPQLSDARRASRAARLRRHAPISSDKPPSSAPHRALARRRWLCLAPSRVVVGAASRTP